MTCVCIEKDGRIEGVCGLHSRWRTEEVDRLIKAAYAQYDKALKEAITAKDTEIARLTRLLLNALDR